MDAEIHRWRNIATSEIYSHPQQKVVLLPKKQVKPSKPQINTHKTKQAGRIRNEPMRHLLDRVAYQQKMDIGRLSSSGYLNANNANENLKNARPETQITAPIRFGKQNDNAGRTVKSSQKIPSLSKDVESTTGISQDIPASSGVSGTTSSYQNATQPVVHGIGSMIDILSEFDPVKLRENALEANAHNSPGTHEAKSTQEGESISTHEKNEKLSIDNQDSDVKPVRRFIPSYQLSLTKQDQFKTLQLIDKTVVQRDQNYIKNSDGGKRDRLKQYYDFIEQELYSNNCPPEGPDVGRLRIFSECFDKLIQEFRTYAPLLSEIKYEYDKTVMSFQEDERELNFLRTKVQKLLSQNENRLLLKYERKKGKELENKLYSVIEENQKLKHDLRRKLAIYASYLPPSVLHDKKRDDSLLAEVESEIRTFAPGEDPLTLAEDKIEELQKEIFLKKEEIEEIRSLQETEFVPRITREKVEDALKNVEEKLKSISEKNKSLELDVANGHGEIRKLESLLREKEQQYQFLITEYNELSEAMASIKTENSVVKTPESAELS